MRVARTSLTGHAVQSFMLVTDGSAWTSPDRRQHAHHVHAAGH